MRELSSPGRIIVVGSINVDLVVRARALPRPGETVVGGTFERHGGGKSANQAVAAARAGGAVRMIGAVGDDDAGRSGIAELSAEGIDVSAVTAIDDLATGVAVIVVGPGGENQIAVASGANALLGQEHVRAGLAMDPLRAGDVCLVSLEIGDEAVLAIAEAASRAGATLIVNPAPARDLGEPLYRHGPILTPNRGEAALLTGVEDPQEAGLALSARTGAPVVVTLGAEGAIVVVPGELPRQVAAHLVEPVDTTGAGDSFNGTLAAGVAAGASLADAVDAAMVAAALTTLAMGARSTAAVAVAAPGSVGS